MKLLKLVVIASLSLGAAGVAADGAALYAAKGCIGCHGAAGEGNPALSAPKLAGLDAAFCQEQVKKIGDGTRSGGNTALMKPTAAGVSAADAAEICAYITAK
jgi:cytochrome c